MSGALRGGRRAGGDIESGGGGSGMPTSSTEAELDRSVDALAAALGAVEPNAGLATAYPVKGSGSRTASAAIGDSYTEYTRGPGFFRFDNAWMWIAIFSLVLIVLLVHRSSAGTPATPTGSESAAPNNLIGESQPESKKGKRGGKPSSKPNKNKPKPDKSSGATNEPAPPTAAPAAPAFPIEDGVTHWLSTHLPADDALRCWTPAVLTERAVATVEAFQTLYTRGDSIMSWKTVPLGCRNRLVHALAAHRASAAASAVPAEAAAPAKAA